MGASVKRFKGVAVSTLRQVLDLLTGQYKDGETLSHTVRARN